MTLTWISLYPCFQKCWDPCSWGLVYPNEFTLMGTVLIYVIEKTVGKADASCEIVSKHL